MFRFNQPRILMELKINYGSCVTGINIEKVEEVYGVKYIGDFCLRTTTGSWGEDPVSIFYQPNPPKPEFSNYLGVFRRGGATYLTNGLSAFEQPIDGVISSNGEVVYSRYRHDFRSCDNGNTWVDGGRDYVRTNIIDRSRWVQLVIQEDKLVVKPCES